MNSPALVGRARRWTAVPELATAGYLIMAGRPHPPWHALLDMTETDDILGTGMVMEMKAMLVVQGGPNLRNDVAHGLLTDHLAWSYSALYMWWFCLRLMIYPVIEMMDRAAMQSSTNDG